MVILTKLRKEGFDKILESYNIGKYKSHKHITWSLGNTVYALRTYKGEFFLKIFEESYPDFINFQVKIMELMENAGIPSPKIIKTKEKRELLTHDGNRIMIQKTVEGREPKRFSNILIKDTAKKQALMNKLLLQIKLEGKYTWGKNYQFKPLNFYVKNFGDLNTKKENNILIQELGNINKEKLRKSVIHGDFHGANLLVKKDKLIAIVDWDDAHEDYLVQEIANFIVHTFIEGENVKKEQMRIYLQEYEKQLKLNKEEKKAIYFFVKHRFLGEIAWLMGQLKKHKDKKEHIEKFVIKTAIKYRNFSKISLEDFMNMF